DAVANRGVVGKLAADRCVARQLVRHEMRLAAHDPDDERAQGFGRDVRNAERIALAVALDQGQYRDLLRATAARAGGVRMAWFAADVGLIRFDNLARSTERPWQFLAHRFTDAMGHKPCGLVGDPQHAVQLVRRYALLARNDEVRR